MCRWVQAAAKWIQAQSGSGQARRYVREANYAERYVRSAARRRDYTGESAARAGVSRSDSDEILESDP